MKKFILIASLAFIHHFSFSQYNSIREGDILFKKRIVRTLHMKHPVNQDLFGRENRLAGILLEAFEQGKMMGYKDDACNDPVSIEEVRQKLQFMAGEDTVDIHPQQLYQVEIAEDLIFDSKRSEIIFDIEAITLMLPERVNSRGLLEPVISFKYDECMKILKEDERAFAENPLHNGKNINFSNVFLLRLFAAEIVKIGNDAYFDQMYADPTLAFIARKDAENKLSEYLYKLCYPK